MSFILGLDVGTASGAGATKRGGRVQPCALGERSPTLPAVVVLHDDGSALVGEEAERVAGLELTRVARSLRHDPVLQMTPITVGGEIRTPHELLRTLYSTMAERVSALHGGPPAQVVLAHPAVPEGVRCEAVERIAAELFPRAMVVPDPVAATVKLACDGVLPSDCTVVVYDLGGGTFDTSLVQRQGDRFSIIGDPAGLSDFGGIDIDDLVLDHVDRSLDGAIAQLDLGDPASIAALSRLRAECRDAKERLSYEAEVTIDASLPNTPALVRLTRDDFDAILGPHLELTVEVLIEMIDRTGVPSRDVDVVALIGGSSRIPAVADIVSARTGMQVLIDPFPELTVAVGAAQMADEQQAVAPMAFPYAETGTPPSGIPGIPGIPGLADVGAPGAYGALGYDEVDAVSPAVGTAVADPPLGAAGVGVDPTLRRDDPEPPPHRPEYDDPGFDMGSRSRLGELVDQGINVRAGAAVLSALAGVAVVIAGAVALGGGGGDPRADAGSVSALGSDDTVGDRSSGLPASSSSSSSLDTSSSSSSSSTTTDDEDSTDERQGSDDGRVASTSTTPHRDGTTPSSRPTRPSTTPSTSPSTSHPSTTPSSTNPSTTEPTTTTTTPSTTEPSTTTTPSSSTPPSSTADTTTPPDDLQPALRNVDRAS